MSAPHSRRAITAGSIALALALAAPVAAFAAPGGLQGPPANPGEQRSATATATIGEQGPGRNAAGGQSGNPGVGDEDAGERKVTLCHATGSQTNPYVVITVAKAAVLNGHADHQDEQDIIPSFTYTDRDGQTQTVPAQGDQSILDAACTVSEGPVSTPVTTPVTTEVVTRTPVQADGGSTTSAEQPATPNQGTTPNQGETPNQGAQNPAAQAAPVSPQLPTDVSGQTSAPATGAFPQTPTPAPAPAPAAPDALVAPTGETVVARSIGGATVVQAATAGAAQVRNIGSVRGAVTPATLPFTGSAELSLLLALGLGAVGLGGIANRVGARELQAKHARR